MMTVIGEVLWDYLDNEKLIGGAALNISYYLKKSGTDVRLISRIGNDKDGKEILEFIREAGIDTENIQVDQTLQTGKVIVDISNNHNLYNIVENVAWDNISIPEINSEFNLMFSSLAQRSHITAKTIKELAKKSAKNFYDVNLRLPYTTKEIIFESLQVADIVKLNEDELNTICEWLNIKADDIEYKAGILREKYKFEALTVTLGEKGAIIITENELYKCIAPKVKINDTIGCGDAFFGTLISGYLKNINWQDNLEHAVKVSSQVAKIKGAIQI